MKHGGLIVLHMMGSHGPAYFKRVPTSFVRFQPACQSHQLSHCAGEQIVNSYDNTILYTDRVLAELIEILSAVGTKDIDTTMIYVSDHGESIGKKGLYLHGMPRALAPREQPHIPFIMWASHAAKMRLGMDMECLQEFAATASVSHDNLFHTVLGIFAIRTRLDILHRCTAGRQPFVNPMHQHVDRPGGRTEAEGAMPSLTGGHTSARRKRFLIFHNPIAGRNRLDVVQEVARCLERAGATVDLRVKADNTPGDGLPAPIETFDAVVASGGDGTVRSMVAMLAGTNVPFGLIPAGTGNVLAEELRLPRKAGEIADMLLHGPVVALSTASINDAPYLLMVGAGFDGEVVADLPIQLKRRIGKPAFGWPILRALARKPRAFLIAVDDRTYEASWLIVANAARYGGRFLLSPKTSILSPGFNVMISRATSRRQRILELFYLVGGRLERARTIEMIPAQTVDIPDATNLAVQVDGEPVASSSYRIVADVARTPMIVPHSLERATSAS